MVNQESDRDSRPEESAVADDEGSLLWECGGLTPLFFRLPFVQPETTPKTKGDLGFPSYGTLTTDH